MASKLTKGINSTFNPSYIGGYPMFALGGNMYGFGSWLKNNAGTVGSVAGLGLGALIGMPGLGMQVGSQIGGSIQQGAELQGATNQSQLNQLKKDTISNLPAQHYYTPTFADGGYMPMITNFTEPINDKLTISKNPVFNDRMRFRRMGPSFRKEADKLDSYISNFANQLNNYNFSEKDKDAIRYKQTKFRRLKEDLFNYQENPKTRKFSFASGGSIHIDPSKKGTFTAAATKHGKGVQAFASQVLANKENYSPTMVKKAVFAHNFAKANGGILNSYADGGVIDNITNRITEFKNGGLHSENGGIPFTPNALVERGEVSYTTKNGKKYIFSDQF